MNEDAPDIHGWLSRWGTAGWRIIGIALASTIVYTALAGISGLVVPLVVATVIGILAVPLVDKLERWNIPRMAGAIIVMLALLVIVSGAFVIAVQGVIEQGDEVTEQLTAAIDRVDQWLEDLDVDVGRADELFDDGEARGRSMLPGLASHLTSIFSSAMAFLIGAFMSLFMLYYVLVDWRTLRDWVGRHLGVSHEMGAGIVDDAIGVLRQGFYALTLSSMVTAVLIGLAMVMLDLPLAFTVGLVTFLTSYIPYLGATISGAFGFLVALGASGLPDALILLVVILVVQNIVQTIVGNRLASERLSLHPLASLISTIIGVTLFGLLGAMLSAPVLALILAIGRRASEARSEVADGAAPAADPA